MKKQKVWKKNQRKSGHNEEIIEKRKSIGVKFDNIFQKISRRRGILLENSRINNIDLKYGDIFYILSEKDNFVEAEINKAILNIPKDKFNEIEPELIESLKEKEEKEEKKIETNDKLEIRKSKNLSELINNKRKSLHDILVKRKSKQVVENDLNDLKKKLDEHDKKLNSSLDISSENDIKNGIKICHKQFSKQKGLVKYVGKLKNSSTEFSWVGIEWDIQGIGKNDGQAFGTRYYQTKMNSSTFIKIDDIIKYFKIII